MKRPLAVLGFCLMFSGLVWAAPTTTPEPATGTAVALAPAGAVGNNPHGAFELFKDGMSYLELQPETLWSFRGHGFRPGFSGALWKFQPDNIYVGSLRAGWAVDDTAYGSAQLEAAGLIQKYAPETFKRFVSPGPLGKVWSLIGKYGRVSGWGGYSWDYDALDYGISGSIVIPLGGQGS